MGKFENPVLTIWARSGQGIRCTYTVLYTCICTSEYTVNVIQSTTDVVPHVAFTSLQISSTIYMYMYITPYACSNVNGEIESHYSTHRESIIHVYIVVMEVYHCPSRICQ